MYVSLQEDDKILVFTMDAGTGKLTPELEVPVSGGPAALALGRDRNALYVGHREVPGISSFRVDQDTGGLVKIGAVSLDIDPIFLSTDREGRFLLTSSYAGAHAAVQAIGDDGAVSAPPIQRVDTATGAHAIQTDRTNKFAFVPHIAGRGPNAIFQFRFDENTGRLTPNSPLKVEPEEHLGPRHYCFHPTQNFLYFSNEQGSSVSGYRLDVSTGTLSAFQTIPTLPADYTGNNTCSQIQITSSGKFLYAPNRGHNSIACFSVDASTGQLTPSGRVASEPIPNALSLDLQDKFLFSAGQESGRMASFSVDPDSGELTPLETYPLGNRPAWILVTSLGA